MHEDLDKLLARLRDGAIDELSPEEIAALEAHLNAETEFADALADTVPVPDCPAFDRSGPTAAEWEGVWQSIESAQTQEAGKTRSPRFVRFWQPLFAAAACLMLVITWRFGASNTPHWNAQLSNDVVVHELEVYDDASSMVAYTGDGSGSAIIWVFEEDEDPAGV